MSADHLIDNLTQAYWKEGGDNVALAREVLNQAIATPPQSAQTLARALSVCRRADAEGYAPEVRANLETPLELARVELALIDELGNDQIDPSRLVFDHLADWIAEQDLVGVDAEQVGQARTGAQTRPHAAHAVLDAVDWGRLPNDVTEGLRVQLDALEREATSHQARSLLVTPDHQAGLVLGVNVRQGDRDGVIALDQVDEAMSKQAAIVLSSFGTERHGVRWSLEWPLPYAGESIGLALRLAALVSFRGLRPDPLLAATGRVTDDGRVHWVEGIPAKLSAARDAGVRRVLLPAENQSEASTAGVDEDLQLLFVEHVDDIQTRLGEVTDADELSFDGKLRQARAALPGYGLSVREERVQQYGRHFVITDAAGRAILEVYESGTVCASGPAGPTRDRVEQLIADVFVGEKPVEREPQRFMLADEWRQTTLREALEREGAQARAVNGNGELFRFAMRRKSSDAQVTMWTSGKGYLTGKAPAFDEVLALISTASEGLANVQAEAKPKSRGPAGGNAPAELPKEGPWIGTDESGKGDYFGPLVSAAVFVDDRIADRLRELGVQDSKKLSDARVRKLAPEVRRVVGEGRYKVTPINPARYNELHAQFKAEGKNLNSLLAWGHTRSIEDLLAGGLKPRYAIVDQFADAKYIQQRLLAEARDSGLEVFQFPKAEADLAVAAASILAREAFIDWLARTSATVGVTLPKGANPKVVDTAKKIAASGGREALAAVAKLHFKTTDQVL